MNIPPEGSLPLVFSGDLFLSGTLLEGGLLSLLGDLDYDDFLGD